MSFSPTHGRRAVLQVTSADILASVRALNAKKIPVYELLGEDALTASLEIDRRYVSRSRELLEKRGDLVKIRRSTAMPLWRYLLTRRLLTFGLGVLGALMLFLPTRILFVEVEGNQAVPRQAILEAAQESGIRLLAPRRAVRSEKMKNALLSRIPQLQWAGVNTYGCRAVISVRERSAQEPPEAQGGRISSIVASRDGIVLSATALSGSLACQEGEAVTQGQILISGYTDCGLCIRATRASGEIYARTGRTLLAMTPSTQVQRGDAGEGKAFYSLILGKKRIKLWKDSGIWDSSCGRIYTVYPLTLPGGFTLPIALARDTVYTAPLQRGQVDAQGAEKMLGNHCSSYLKTQMIAGSIYERSETFSDQDGVYLLRGKYDCVEMIGRERMEKIGDLYGEDS